MSKGDAYIRVECDTCHDFIDIELTFIAGREWDERNVDGELERQGWRDEGDNIHTCSMCLEDWDEGE